MQTELIDLSPDLKKLRDEGYEIYTVGATALISHVPYLNSQSALKFGVLASPLKLQGDVAVYDRNHVIMFSGEYPHYGDGTKITAIEHAVTAEVVGGVRFRYKFSNKPSGGYRDLYEKFTRYIEIISAPAQEKYPTESARTYRKPASRVDDIFVYQDSNTARAGITDISDRLRGHKVAIIGLGGTGSYVLDYVAKTPVLEIHLIDGDKFMQHNAFRAPGAPSCEELAAEETKVSYHAKHYQNMRNNIFPHALMLDNRTESVLGGIDFAFVCIDSDAVRANICCILARRGIPYVDCGMGLSIADEKLRGSIRCTAVFQPQMQAGSELLEDVDIKDDAYSTNIQIAELNALNAALAVIKWKKHLGFYLDQMEKLEDVYSLDCGGIVHESGEI